MLSSGGEGENYEKDVDDPIVDEDHERMLQMMEEIRKAKYEKNTAEAIAKGYSSFEELVEERMERSRHLQKAHEKYMEEKAASLGITVDELIEQDPQRDRHTPYLAETPPIQCDCDGWCQVIELNRSYTDSSNRPFHPLFLPSVTCPTTVTRCTRVSGTSQQPASLQPRCTQHKTGGQVTQALSRLIRDILDTTKPSEILGPMANLVPQRSDVARNHRSKHA